MYQIQIEDIELLKTLRENITDISQQISNLPIVKRLDEKESEKKDLKNKTMKHSTYDVEQMYYEKKDVTADDIVPLLADISNKTIKS